jgi:hypothetical protein
MNEPIPTHQFQPKTGFLEPESRPFALNRSIWLAERTHRAAVAQSDAAD